MQFRPVEIIALFLLFFLIAYMAMCIFTHPFVNIGDAIICIGFFLFCVAIVFMLGIKRQ